MSTPSNDGDRALPRKQGRSVPAIYGIVSLVLVVGAVTFALSTPPPSTPPLAAVAPAPQEQLEVERVEQSSQFGEGTGGEGDCAPGDAGCAGVGEAEPADEQAAAEPPPAGEPGEPEVVETQAPGQYRRCANGPGGTRQTEDPQSPRCIQEIFQGDNGGATSTGVTRDTVRIAVPWPLTGGGWINGQGNEERDIEFLEAFAAHVEQYYELYGRSLELVQVDRPDARGPAAERAFASDLAALEVFATLEYASGSVPFYAGAAQNGIVVLDGARGPIADTAVYDPFHPYVWGVFPSLEQSLHATGDLACTALVDRPARHAGEDLAAETRRFGLIVEHEPGRSLDARVLSSRLSACGAPFEVYDHTPDKDDAATLVRAMQHDGVTTVVCVCNDWFQRYAREATPAGYEPEWLLPGLPEVGDARAVTANGAVDRAQRDGVFGLSADLRDAITVGRPPAGGRQWEDYYWFRALKEQRPDLEVDRGNQDRGWKGYRYYAQFLILASGIQHAGPDLTPETFADALQRPDTFPNPWVGAAPFFQPLVGFGPGDHTFNSDFSLTWWQNSEEHEEQATPGAKGAFCYVGGGARFTVGTFPADADRKFFDPEAGCR